jgi:hypothetical protein
MTIGFVQSAQHGSRRPYYGPGSGRKLGYYATGQNGEQFLQATNGRVVARIIRWKNGFVPGCY